MQQRQEGGRAIGPHDAGGTTRETHTADDPLAHSDVERAIDADAAWRAVVRRALTACGRMAAPGPSGLRAEHVRAALAYGPLSDALDDALAEVVDGLVAGQLPTALRNVGSSSSPNGSRVRSDPGEVLRSIACRCALPALVAELRPQAELQGQLGMSRAGAQRATARIHAAHRRGDHIVAIDLRNASNELSRRFLLAPLPADVAGHELIVA